MHPSWWKESTPFKPREFTGPDTRKAAVTQELVRMPDADRDRDNPRPCLWTQ